MTIAVATLVAVLCVSVSAAAKGSGAANGFVANTFNTNNLIGGGAQGSGHITLNNKNGQPPANNNFNHVGGLVNNNPAVPHDSVNSFVNNNNGFTSSDVNNFVAGGRNLNNGNIINNAVAGIASSMVSVKAATSWVSETYIYPYTYLEFYSHHVAHIYVSETCPPPPSSIEVCLSSIFDSMEYYLKVVESSLVKHEVSIHNYMHHEHSLLTSEISWAKSVNRIAYGVKKAVHVDEHGVSIEISQLIEQKEIISELYEDLLYQLEEIEEAVSVNIFQINYIKQEYAYVKTAKWQLYGYISAIVYERGAVNIAINEIQEVVTQLRVQISKIYTKISQLNRRQQWLVKWETTLYTDLTAFSKDVTRFRAVQTDLYSRQVSLYAQQKRLQQEAIYAKNAVLKLKEEYRSILEYLSYLEVYQKEIISIYYSISIDAKSFISAYEEFTCQDSLLYYEACASTPKTPAKPTTGKPAVAKPTAKPSGAAAAAAKAPAAPKAPKAPKAGAAPVKAAGAAKAVKTAAKVAAKP